MKRIKLVLSALLVYFLLPSTLYAHHYNCLVIAISDGDTIRCLTAEKKQLKVRLSQIDAPENKQAFGTAAKKY